MRASVLLLVVLAGCATTRATTQSVAQPASQPLPPPAPLTPADERFLATLFDTAANGDVVQLAALIDWARYRRVQTWDMTRMQPVLCFMFVDQLEHNPMPPLGWRGMVFDDVRRRLAYVAPNHVPPTPEPIGVLGELQQSERPCPRAADLAAEVLHGADEVTYRGPDGSTLTVLLVGDRLAGLIGTPKKQ